MNSIIISIKPIFCKAIYTKDKIIELRKSIGARFRPGAKLYIYTTSPEKAITGEATIDKVQRLTISEIKSLYLARAFINEKEFDEYYCGKAYGYAISLTDTKKYRTAIPLNEMKKIGFHAPQSYLYPNQHMINYIESNKCI